MLAADWRSDCYGDMDRYRIYKSTFTPPSWAPQGTGAHYRHK
jgi:hypothetical protein